MATNRLEAQFLRAYDELADPIFRYCYFRLFDRERARELMQETFLRTWQRLTLGEEIKELRAYLYRTAYHLIVDEAMKKKALSLDALQDAGFQPSADEGKTHEHRIELALIERYIDRLEPEERDLILLRYVNGLPPKEVAKILGVTPNVASVRIHRALKKLKALLPV
ncbi:MAG: hypothetical protein UY81_C0036G0002 [Candidatus Giovannonibacteria bacterium GW2011_GWA2_53_7]|uniref:RNA polymerase, sigma-24 subunit, ECF subfamily n=1 Tax=Candidatus Giovannonibacteria bacterium GW2011_GWA2_53_7 TaxID=1618650 RepID=A0A0G2ASN3_9BACT|nr:MAG: hypothetical protein UY81_C0036G0002 [Candidatus Giovannonibacteria bacterium GW2011_GWA2_53_7]